MKFLALAAAAAALRLTGTVADCCEGAVCTGALKTAVAGCATYDGCGKQSCGLHTATLNRANCCEQVNGATAWTVKASGADAACAESHCSIV